MFWLLLIKSCCLQLVPIEHSVQAHCYLLAVAIAITSQKRNATKRLSLSESEPLIKRPRKALVNCEYLN